MQAAARAVVWPCDLATAEAGFLVVRESTHRWSARLQHRAMIDKRMLLLETAIGRACLAAAGEAGRKALLELLRRRGAGLGEPERDAAFVQQRAVQTLQCGYALNEIE